MNKIVCIYFIPPPEIGCDTKFFLSILSQPNTTEKGVTLLFPKSYEKENYKSS